MFALIDPQMIEDNANLNKKTKGKILQHCGYEDTVVNHILLLKSANVNKLEQVDLERIADKSMLSRRAFTVQCIFNMEILTLGFNVID